MFEGDCYGYDVMKVPEDDLKSILGILEGYFMRNIDHNWGMYFTLCLTHLTDMVYVTVSSWLNEISGKDANSSDNMDINREDDSSSSSSSSSEGEPDHDLGSSNDVGPDMEGMYTNGVGILDGIS